METTQTRIPFAGRTVMAACLTCAAVWSATTAVSGSTIWNGPTITYTQPGTDATQPANQDRLTDNVWLTRNDTHGLFNAAQETFYTSFFSPKDTEWAYGELTNYASLMYNNWQTWNGSSPPSMVGQDAVVHLISDDIYLSIHFTLWSDHGGPFAYIRSTPNVVQPPPAVPVLINAGLTNGNSFQFIFTNAPGYTFTVLGTTNIAQTLSNWTVLGQVTNVTSGSSFYQFIETGAVTNRPRRFYRVTWP